MRHNSYDNQFYQDFGGFDGLNQPTPNRSKRFGWGSIAASAVLFLLLGFLGGCLLMRQTSFDRYYSAYLEAAGNDSNQPAEGEEEDLPEEQDDSNVPDYSDPTQGYFPAAQPETDPTERGELPVPKLGADTKPVIHDNTRASDISEQVGTSVVNVTGGIKIYSTVTNRELEQDVSYGSGIILTEDGYIVTNYHIIEDCTYVYVTIGEEEYPAQVLGTDSIMDLSVLKIEATGLNPVAIGDSSTVKPGDYAAVIGNSLGTLSGTITQGIISGVNREVNVDGRINSYIQTDAAMNVGTSGGALLNGDGELIGISNMKAFIVNYDEYGNAIQAEGVGYAIPINDVMPVVEQLIQYGYVNRPAIGIMAYEMSEIDAEEMQMPQGLYITSVYSAGPAAGVLQADDIVLSADGVRVTSMNELTGMIRAKNVGDTITLHIWRDGTELDVTVEIGDQNRINEAQKEADAALYGEPDMPIN